MSHIHPYPLDLGHNAWMNNFSREINNKKLLAGPGVNITQGNDGTTISVPGDNRKDNLTYQGLYNFSNSYSPLDLVSVDPTLVYMDENNQTIPFIYTASYYSGSLPPIAGGLYVCCAYIPPITATSGSFITSIGPLINISGSFDAANSYRWYDYNVYYPIYPQIPTGSQQLVVDGSGYTILANNTFWTALSPMSVVNICNNAGVNTMYLSGIVSGSVFSASQLPYT